MPRIKRMWVFASYMCPPDQEGVTANGTLFLRLFSSDSFEKKGPSTMPHVGTSLSVELDAGGIVLPALGLHLDPHAAVGRAVVSHADGDHIGAVAQETIASRETLALIEARGGARPGARALDWGEALELPVEGGGTARVSIAPAGHVLGAAQLVIDHPG